MMAAFVSFFTSTFGKTSSTNNTGSSHHHSFESGRQTNQPTPFLHRTAANKGTANYALTAIVKHLTTKPRRAFVQVSGLPIAFLVACAVLIAYTPVKVDVGITSFQVKDEPAVESCDAFNVAYAQRKKLVDEMDANPYPTGRRKLMQAGDEYSAQNKEYRPVRWRVHVIYHATNDKVSVLHPDAVADMKRAEDAMRAVKGYDDFCATDYQGTCRPPVSLVSLLYPSAPGVNDGKGTDMQSISATVYRTLAEGVYWFTDAGFNSKDITSARYVRADFLFGSPITAPVGDQYGKFKRFTRDLIHVLREASTDRVQVRFGGDGITEEEVLMTLLNDAMLSLISLTLVGTIMAIHTRSMFLTVAGLAQIILAFPMAYVIYAGGFGIRYVGLLNVSSFFVILGVGVDDLFVFYDTLRAERRALGWHASGTVEGFAEALFGTYMCAGKAMFATSFTTGVAFLASAVSAIPALRHFGIFLSLLVLMNYILAMTWFPSILCIYELRGWSKLTYRDMWRSVIKSKDRMPQWHGNASNEYETLPSDTEQNIGSDVDLELEQADGYGGIDETLTNHHHKWNAESVWCTFTESINRYKDATLAAYFVLAIICLCLASQLQPSTELPKFFPQGSNLDSFVDLSNNMFLSTWDCDSCVGKVGGSPDDSGPNTDPIFLMDSPPPPLASPPTNPQFPSPYPPSATPAAAGTSLPPPSPHLPPPPWPGLGPKPPITTSTSTFVPSPPKFTTPPPPLPPPPPPPTTTTTPTTTTATTKAADESASSTTTTPPANPPSADCTDWIHSQELNAMLSCGGQFSQDQSFTPSTECCS